MSQVKRNAAKKSQVANYIFKPLKLFNIKFNTNNLS